MGRTAAATNISGQTDRPDTRELAVVEINTIRRTNLEIPLPNAWQALDLHGEW